VELPNTVMIGLSQFIAILLLWRLQHPTGSPPIPPQSRAKWHQRIGVAQCPLLPRLLLMKENNAAAGHSEVPNRPRPHMLADPDLAERHSRARILQTYSSVPIETATGRNH